MGERSERIVDYMKRFKWREQPCNQRGGVLHPLFDHEYINMSDKASIRAAWGPKQPSRNKDK